MEEKIINIGKRPAIDYIAKELGKGLVGAEIGVNKGYNTSYICNIIQPKILYLIDPWNNFFDSASGEIIGETQLIIAKDLLKIFPCCKFIRKASFEATEEFNNESLDFAYIDANHSYQAVLLDCICWYAKIKSGGILSGHDFTTDSVKRAVLFFGEKYKIKQISTQNEDFWFRKE